MDQEKQPKNLIKSLVSQRAWYMRRAQKANRPRRLKRAKAMVDRLTKRIHELQAPSVLRHQGGGDVS